MREYQVILGTPVWSLNGVNVFISRLARGLMERGVRARILVTRPQTRDSKPMPMPSDLPFEVLPVKGDEPRFRRWQAMKEYLSERAPCVYLPNHDYEYSCVSPQLSGKIGIVGIVHSDDPEHYEHVKRLGSYWDAVVVLNEHIRRRTLQICPALQDRMITIPMGIDYRDEFPQREDRAGGFLKMVYAGCLKQYQKRVFDLPQIVEELVRLRVPVQLKILGGGPDARRLVRRANHLIEEGHVRFLGIVPQEKVLRVMEGSDVFLLTSEFEGMPNALLEAMASGCIPVVTDIPSSIPDLIEHGKNGYRLPIGDIRMFAQYLGLLYRDPSRRQAMRSRVHATLRNRSYHLSTMVTSYQNLFRRVMENREPCRIRGAANKILAPPVIGVYYQNRLRSSLKDFARAGRGRLSRIFSDL